MSVVFERVVGSLGASLTPEDFIPSTQENTPDDDSVAVSPDSSMSLDVALEEEEGPLVRDLLPDLH